MDSIVVKKSKIEIEIGLDKENVPTEITWRSSDAPANYPVQNAKAMLLSFLDRDSRDTLKIDLWTKDMEVGEMDRMMFDTLRALADTYYKASNNRELAEHMQHFAHFFGEKTKVLIPK
jgi:gliding motility-associated protein GldC